jgi:hypothetical protein
MTPLLFVLALVAGAVLTAVAGHFYLKRRAAAPDPVVHFRCSHCGQKLRCTAGPAGRRAMCPSCMRPCLLPAAGTETPSLGRADARRV